MWEDEFEIGYLLPPIYGCSTDEFRQNIEKFNSLFSENPKFKSVLAINKAKPTIVYKSEPIGKYGIVLELWSMR